MVSPKVDIVQTHELTNDTWWALQAYLTSNTLTAGPLLYGSSKGGQLTERPISIRAVKKRVAYIGRTRLRIGLGNDDSLSPHDCRHYWATDAARNGTDPFRLQEAGGWASLSMPRQYVEAAEVANKGVKLSE
jgi:integrase